MDPLTTVRRPIARGVVATRRVGLAIAVFVASALVRSMVAQVGADDVWAMAAATPAAIAAADLVSGLAHWGCDTFFAEDTPVLGPFLITSFRNHHRDPLAIVGAGAIDNNSAASFAALPILAVGFVPGAPAWLQWGALVCALALSLTNQIHAWAHAAHVPAPVRWLQRIGLLLSPEHHDLHHVSLTTHFAITNGWTNPLLDAILFVTGAPRGRPEDARRAAPTSIL